MNPETADYFATYEEWRRAITGRCGIELTTEYCEQRIEALRDSSDPSTKSFVQLYGKAYQGKVVAWFQKAKSAA